MRSIIQYTFYTFVFCTLLSGSSCQKEQIKYDQTTQDLNIQTFDEFVYSGTYAATAIYGRDAGKNFEHYDPTGPNNFYSNNPSLGFFHAQVRANPGLSAGWLYHNYMLNGVVQKVLNGTPYVFIVYSFNLDHARTDDGYHFNFSDLDNFSTPIFDLLVTVVDEENQTSTEFLMMADGTGPAFDIDKAPLAGNPALIDYIGEVTQSFLPPNLHRTEPEQDYPLLEEIAEDVLGATIWLQN